jgi:hypothetical protein
MNTGILFRAYFHKKITQETWPKIYLGPDPHVYKSLIQIRSKIVRIHQCCGSGSGRIRTFLIGSELPIPALINDYV